MKLLVIGASGLLGSNVVDTGLKRGWEVRGTFYSREPDFDIPLTKFDLRNSDKFGQHVGDYDPDVVVNCAAMTGVDACETSPEKAYALNSEAPGKLATTCSNEGIKFVHISTDYVFDGTADKPYDETASTSPQQIYGESKLSGERVVRDNADSALVARLSFVWGVQRDQSRLTGFPAWVKRQLDQGNEPPLFTDQKITPSRAGHAASAILDLVETEHDGLFHIASSSCVTPFSFGELIAEQIGYSTDRLQSASLADVKRDAVRPHYSCLEVNKIESTLGRPQPELRTDIGHISHIFD